MSSLLYYLSPAHLIDIGYMLWRYVTIQTEDDIMLGGVYAALLEEVLFQMKLAN